MLQSRVAWVVLGLVCACGGSSSKKPDAAVAADAPPDVPTRTVTGHYVAHFVTPSGESAVAADLSRATIEVLVPPSTTPILGTGAADGTFSIQGVPVGDYVFAAGTHYIVASGDTLDLDFYLVGRATDGNATSPTNLTLNVTNLDTWQTGDELELYSPQTGTLAFDLEASASAGAPAASATSLSGMVYDLSQSSNRALVSATAGDAVTVAQLSLTSDGTRSYSSISRTFSPAPFTVTNGGTATLTGAFDAVTASQTLAMTWDRPAFAADLAAHFPGAASQSWSTFAITALQGAATHGFFDGGPDVLVFAPGYTTDTTTVSASWPYGDPFPTDWGRIAWCRYYRYRMISLPGATPAPIFARLLTYRDLSTLATDATVEPGIGAVIAPKINGDDALSIGSLTGVGTTPALSWTAPAIGTAAKYYVTVYSVAKIGGATTLQRTAVIETPYPQLVIPPTLLTAGQPYVFEIAARASTADLVAHPNVYALPEAFSSVTTTIVTP